MNRRINRKFIAILSLSLIALLFIGFSYFSTSLLHSEPNTNTHSSKITDEIILLPNQLTQRVLHHIAPEKGLLIFIADSDTPLATVETAKKFADLSYYVAIIDNKQLLQSAANTDRQCLDLSKQIETQSAYINSHYNINSTDLPIIVGEDTSSPTVYAILKQVKTQQFHAAAIINFNTTFKFHTPLCEQNEFITAASESSFKLKNTPKLSTSLYVFQDVKTGSDDENTQFFNDMSNVKLTLAKESGESAKSESIQILQWLDPRLLDQTRSSSGDNELPIIVTEADSSISNQDDIMALLLTGDGGWAEIDKEIVKLLSAQGIPSIALDSLNYFWKARTPLSTSQDINSLLSEYQHKWGKKRIMLIGYSFGADALPFIANQLPAETQKKISIVALLAMGKTASFEFRLSSWLNNDKNSSRLPIFPELEKMKWANSICVYGLDDEDTGCASTSYLGVKIIAMKGDHHFNEDYETLVNHILSNQKSIY